MINSRLSKKVGKCICELLKVYLVKKVQADSEKYFDDALQAARNLIHAQKISNGQLEKDLEEFASIHKTHSIMLPCTDTRQQRTS